MPASTRDRIALVTRQTTSRRVHRKEIVVQRRALDEECRLSLGGVSERCTIPAKVRRVHCVCIAPAFVCVSVEVVGPWPYAERSSASRLTSNRGSRTLHALPQISGRSNR
jgi:hypothetical protein